jgi:hypothetical protein
LCVPNGARDDPLSASKVPVAAKDLRGRVFLTLDRGDRLSRIVHALAEPAAKSHFFSQQARTRTGWI